MTDFLFFSFRYIKSSKGTTFLISIISFLGVLLGVSGILLTNGVFEGFQIALRDKILNVTPNVVMTYVSDKPIDKEKVESFLKKSKFVKSFSYFEIYHGAIQNGSSINAVNIDLVNMKKKDSLSNVSSKIIQGTPKPGTVVLGQGLAFLLGVNVGDKVNIISPMGIKTPLGFIPKTKEVKVSAIFNTGIFDLDYQTIFLDKALGESIFEGSPKTEGFNISLKDPYKANLFKKELEKRFKDYFISSWIDLNRPLFEALETEERGIFFVLTLMIVIASFNITSLLFVKIKEKMRDFGVMLAFGIERSFILKIVVSQGVFIGILGSFAGVLLSLFLEKIINDFRLIKVPKTIYLMSYVPIHISLVDVLKVFSIGIALSFLASLIPALILYKQKPIEILKND